MAETRVNARSSRSHSIFTMKAWGAEQGLMWIEVERDMYFFWILWGGGFGFLVHKGCMVDFFEFGPFFSNLRPNTSTISVSARLLGLGFFRENNKDRNSRSEPDTRCVVNVLWLVVSWRIRRNGFARVK